MIHSSSAAASVPSLDASVCPSLSRKLGLIGLGSIEPVVLASLAIRAPMLLIGTHGSAKSLLLERLAGALGLSWRHYNAALVNFDDLVGYPLPDQKGELRYVQTPASVWGAQAVFIDEISRARIDMQNRLFPIIHERRAQGIDLEQLEHRWAAMNPPGQRETDADEDAEVYAGSSPLDLALADRFALHVTMPDWRRFDAELQEEVISAGTGLLGASHVDATHVDASTGDLWRAALKRTREVLPLVDAQWGRAIARYVRVLCSLLEQASRPVSARRAGMMARNVLAVHAARMARSPLQAPLSMDDSAWIATLNSLPFAACGKAVDPSKLLLAHREAWRQAQAAADDPLGAVLAEKDPLKRLRLAIAAERLPDGELTSIVVDCLSQAVPGQQHAMAKWLFESPALQRLSVVATDAVGALYRDLACVHEFDELSSPMSQRYKLWQFVRGLMGQLTENEQGIPKINLLAALFASNKVQEERKFKAALKAYESALEDLGMAA